MRKSRNGGERSLDQFHDSRAPPLVVSPLHLPEKVCEVASAAYQVLWEAAFITSLGCVCAVPCELADKNLGLLVDIALLQIASQALGFPLLKRHLRALVQTSEQPESNKNTVRIRTSILLRQWSRLNVRDNESSLGSRALFAERFSRCAKKLRADDTRLEKRFGRPYAAEDIDEDMQVAFCESMQLPYIRGAHYGFCWRPLSMQRNSSKIVEHDASLGCFPEVLSFRLNMHIPGPPMNLTEEGSAGEMLERILSQRASALRGALPPLVVLMHEIPNDGRMLLMAKAVEDSLCSKREISPVADRIERAI